MLHIRLDDLAETALSASPSRNIEKHADITKRHNSSNESISQDLFSLISDLFNKKIT